MKELLLCGCLIALLVIAVMAFNIASHAPAPANISADSIPGQPWQPSRLQISAIHVDAPIIFVGKTASGAMNAPVSKAINSPYGHHLNLITCNGVWTGAMATFSASSFSPRK